jgi:hypothetical protein
MPPTPPTIGEKDVSDFATFLVSTRPKTVAELSEELNKLVGAVRETGKAGSLTLTITLKPVDGSTSVLGVHDVIKVRKPEHTRMGSLAYPDSNNRLSRSDPNSMPLFEDESDVRSAPETANPSTGEVKEAPNS